MQSLRQLNTFGKLEYNLVLTTKTKPIATNTTSIANTTTTCNSNSIQYADLSLIRPTLRLLLRDILDYTNPPLPLSPLTVLPFYLLFAPMNPLPPHTPPASIRTITPPPLPLPVTLPFKLPPRLPLPPHDNTINDQLTSLPSSQVLAIHYSQKTTSNDSHVNRPKKLTDYQIRAFAEQLERYLTSDPANHDFLAKGATLRKLMQHTKPGLLCAWLQLYANPTVQFSYPKTLF